MNRGFIVLFLLIPTFGMAQSVLGKWKTVDEHTHEIRSIIELVEMGGNVSGRIIKLFPSPGDDPDPICDKCDLSDPRHNQKVLGMEIVRGLKAHGKEYSGGEILDPEEGKVYKVKMWVEGKELKVRGYWGLFHRTQTWLPVE